MKKKKLWMPLTALLVLAILLVAYGVMKHINSQAEADTTSDSTDTITVTDIDTTTVNEVTFTVEGKLLDFKMTDGSWVLQGYEDFPLDTSQVTQLLTAVDGLTATRQLDDITDLTEYGLSDPQNIITVTTEDGTVTTLTIGNEVSSSGNYAYVNDDTSTVYMTGSKVSSNIPESLMAMAEEDSFPTITTSNITSMEVTKPSGSFSMKSNADTGNWEVTGTDGTAYSAEYQEISTLESTLAGLTFTGLVDYKEENLAQYGLTDATTLFQAHYTETVTTDSQTEESTSEDATESAAGSSSTDSSSDSTADSSADSSSESTTTTVEQDLCLYIGNKTDDGASYYVRLDGSSDVHTMSAESIESVTKLNAADYWSTAIGAVSVNNISGITVTYDGDTKNITKNTEEETDDDGNTTTTTTYSCDGSEVDETLFSTFYNKLVAMTAQSKDSSYQATADTVFTVVYHTEDGDQTVSFSPYNENFYLAIDTEGRPGMVGKTAVKELLSAYEALGV